MNFLFLKYFHDTLKFNSVTEAAKHNYVTQSAISQGIQQLERSLNVKLLTHKRNVIKATPEGLIVYQSSRTLLGKVNALKAELQGNQDSYVGELSFACSHSFALSILPDLLTQFKKLAPKVTPKVIFGHTGLIKNWIKQGEIEFGLVLDNDDLTSFSLKPLYSGRFHFFHSFHRPKKTPFLSAIFPPARHEVHLVKELFLKKFGFPLQTEMEICSWEVILRLISQNESIGFIPDYILLNSVTKDRLEIFEPELSIPYSLLAAYPTGEELSKNATFFLQTIAQIFIQ